MTGSSVIVWGVSRILEAEAVEMTKERVPVPESEVRDHASFANISLSCAGHRAAHRPSSYRISNLSCPCCSRVECWRAGDAFRDLALP
jgi:hypothetical protein